MHNSTRSANSHAKTPRIVSTGFLASLAMGVTCAIITPAIANDDGFSITLPGDTSPGGGGYMVRDSSGRRTGTVEASPGGGYIVRDTSGRRTGTIEPSATGSGFITRDTSGRRTGTIEKR